MKSTHYPSMILTFILSIAFFSNAFAQWSSDPLNTTHIYNTDLMSGKVGIGINPLVDGPPVNPPGGQVKSPFLQIHGQSGTTGGQAQILLPVVKITAPNNTRSLGLGMNNLGYPSFLHYSFLTTEGRFRINSTELEVMGTSLLRSKVIIHDGPAVYPLPTPGAYRLYVTGGILTEKIKVALSTDAVNWSDFVFDKEYKLRPLSEVETFVKEHKHLPEIPSSEEVYRDGIDLAQMDAKLLMKIEELTLYMIELKKENEQLKSEVELLKEKVK